MTSWDSSYYSQGIAEKKESDEGSSRQWPRQIQGITAKESQKNESHEGSNRQSPRQIQGITAKELQKKGISRGFK